MGGKRLARDRAIPKMSIYPRIGLACPYSGERATLLDWCTVGRLFPVPMIDAGSIARELDGEGFEALVIDADLAVTGDTPFVLRNLERNRPLIVIGDRDAASLAEPARADVTYLKRPLSRDSFLLAIALALAEGRPVRRSPRRPVARIQATVDIVPAHVIDVSCEGIRLEMAERHRSTLPPFFSVKVPMFKVNVVGKRVWVNSAIDQRAERVFWCGVRLERNTERALEAWQTLVEYAPGSEGIRYL
jgi:hypothetical protein